MRKTLLIVAVLLVFVFGIFGIPKGIGPSAWKNGILTSEGKTVGTFSNEMPDGDQSVIVNSQDDKTSRIQLATKHGK